MTDATFIVFQDSFKGMKWIPQLGANTLEEAIQNITEGCVGMRSPSQHFVYFIYQSHVKKFPLHATHYNVFKFRKTVAGSSVSETMKKHKEGLEYALIQTSPPSSNEEKKNRAKKIQDLFDGAEGKEREWKKELTKIEIFNQLIMKCGDLQEHGLVSEFRTMSEEANQRRGKLEEEFTRMRHEAGALRNIVVTEDPTNKEKKNTSVWFFTDDLFGDS